MDPTAGEGGQHQQCRVGGPGAWLGGTRGMSKRAGNQNTGLSCHAAWGRCCWPQLCSEGRRLVQPLNMLPAVHCANTATDLPRICPPDAPAGRAPEACGLLSCFRQAACASCFRQAARQLRRILLAITGWDSLAGLWAWHNDRGGAPSLACARRPPPRRQKSASGRSAWHFHGPPRFGPTILREGSCSRD